MTRSPVKSSHIKTIGHEGDTLEVEYANGSIYRYSGIDDNDYAVITGGDSIGSGVSKATRKEGVTGKKLEPEILEIY